MSGEWWDSVPEAGDVFDGVRRRLAGQKWDVVTAEIVSVRGYPDHGKALTLIVSVDQNQFTDVSAVIEGNDLHKIRRFFRTHHQELELAPGRGLTARGDWDIAENDGNLVLHIRHIGLNVTDVGPTGRWRAAQQAAVTASGNVVQPSPRRRRDVVAQFADVRDRLIDRNIVVIGHRRTEGGNDLVQRVQSNLRDKLKFSKQTVQGRPDVVSRDIAQRLDGVSAHDTALIVIVRGGGGAANRMPFDSALIANAIAACEKRNVPVITALGHTRDIHLADLVAWCSCTTPTDAGTVINSIWHADPISPTPAYAPASVPAPTVDTPPAAPLVPRGVTEQKAPTYPPLTPAPQSSGAKPSGTHHGCLSTVVVLIALLAALVLLVHFFSSSSDMPNDSPSAASSPRVFASPSKNILCSSTPPTVRCDLNTVYYQMNSVPKRCRTTPNWGHVFVLDAKRGRMACPKARHTSSEYEALATLAYGHTMKIGRTTCTSTANYMKCTRGRHGFRISKEAHRV